MVARSLDGELCELLLDTPQLMGVESIELDNVNLRMVARTLPGKQFEVGRQLRVMIIAALSRAGIVTPSEARDAVVGAVSDPSAAGGDEVLRKLPESR